jgi:hypothetical protein
MIKFTEQLEQEEIDDDLYNKIVDYLLDEDDEKLDDKRRELYYEIMDEMFGEFEEEEEDYESEYEDEGEYAGFDDIPEDELDEAMAAKKKKISPIEKAKRRRLYRKSKVKIKTAGKKRRKTTAFKKYKKKAKRMATKGKTSTGKRRSKYM